MSFPAAFLDELRQRLPLSSIANRKMKLVRAGREYKACCPFHQEKTPSFTINDEKQFYHCFGCGAHGDVVGLTMRLDGLSFPEAIESLAAQAGLTVPQDTPRERAHYDKEKRLYQLLDAATGWFEEQLYAPHGRAALSYLKGRGLEAETLRRFRLGFAPSDAQALPRKMQEAGFSLPEMLEVGLIKKAEDRPDHYSFFRNRVMFPVGDRRGRTVAFGGRVMGDGEPKYLNSPDHPLFHKGKLLYGLSRARAAVDQLQPLIVVEGYMDVIALVEAGYIGAVAPLGTAMTEDQLQHLWRVLPLPEARQPTHDYSPILCFDGDSAGQRAAVRAVERALPLLTASETVRVATLPPKEDPDSLIKTQGKSAMQEVLDRAKPMIDMVWDLTAEGRSLQTPEDRASFMAALRKRVSRIADERLRRLYEEDIKQRLSTLFQWGQKSTFQGKGAKGAYGKKSPFAPLSVRPPRNPPKGAAMRERILLALMVNYPQLFDEFGEDFGRFPLTNSALEPLRNEIITFLTGDSHETLDAEPLYRHLSVGDSEEACRAGLAEVLSETTYMHAGFARPERSLELARHGWKTIWNKHLQELLQADLEEAKRRYMAEATDENLKRLMALREQMETMIRDSAALLPDEGAIVDTL